MRLVPDPERYGLAAPMGLPTVCQSLSKPTLNLLQTLIDASFYMRVPIWDELVHGRTAAQRSVVADYYRFLGQSLTVLSDDEVPPLARGHLDAARSATANGPWATVTI